MLFRIIFFFSLLLLHINNAAASPESQNRDVAVIKADVTLVAVDAIVRDKTGALIDNLRAEDFAVFDNGVAQQIALFAHEEIPLDIALVVDGSSSEALYIKELQKAALTVLQQLNPGNDRVALFCFNRWTFQLTGLTLDRFLLENRIGKIPILGWTNINDALWESSHYIRSKGPNRRRAIILISDNCPNEVFPRHGNKETLNEILEAGATLYSIKTPGDNSKNTSLLFDANPKEIASLAAKTGGEVINVKSAADFQKALNSAIMSLKHSYTLGFYPSDKGKAGSYHTLKVKLHSKSALSVKARTGYYVTQAPVLKSGEQTRTARNIFSDPIPSSLDSSNIPLSPILESIIRDIQEPPRNDMDNLSKGLMRQATRIIDFSATLTNYAHSESVPKATIELKIDAANLFFRFIDGKYKGTVSAVILQGSNPEVEEKRYELSYPEEGFGHVLQSRISLSIMISSPKLEDVRIILFQPDSNFYGIQPVRIPP